MKGGILNLFGRFVGAVFLAVVFAGTGFAQFIPGEDDPRPSIDNENNGRMNPTPGDGEGVEGGVQTNEQIDLANYVSTSFNLRAEAGSEQIIVRWDRPDDFAGLVTRYNYTVHWRERRQGRSGDDNATTMTASVISQAEDLSHTIPDLTNARRYDVWVTARSETRLGLMSPTIAAVPVSDPDDPYAEDPLELVTLLHTQKTYPTFDEELIGVYLCDVGHDSIYNMETAIERLNEVAAPYFEWLSGGAYTPVFVPGGRVEGTLATPARGRLSKVNPGQCPFAIRDELRGLAEGDDPSIFSAVMIVALADNASLTDESALFSAFQGGFATIANTVNEPYYPGNLHEVYVTSEVLRFRPQVLVHEMGHSLKWPHSYSTDQTYAPSNEYDNPMDIMSGASDQTDVGLFSGTLAINRYGMGWIAPDKVAVHDLSGDSQSYTLRAAGADPGNNEYEMLVIPGNAKGHYYTLGARVDNPAGYDSELPKSGVEMYEVEFSKHEDEISLVLPAMRARIQQISEEGGTTTHVFADGEGHTLQDQQVEITVSNAGAGAYSVTVMPVAGALPPPQNTAVARTTGQVTLSWEPPAARSGVSPPTGYKAYLRYFGFFDDTTRRVIVTQDLDANAREHTFDLSASPEYQNDYINFLTRIYGAPEVWVTAVNENGEGAESQHRNGAFLFDINRMASVSYHLVGTNSVRVDWQRIDQAPALFGEYLREITVHWRHLETGNTGSQSQVLGTGSPYDTSHVGRITVSPGGSALNYEFHAVFARYRIAGTYTFPTFRFDRPPDSPRNPALSPGNKVITVDWLPPADTHGLSISNYVVYWRVAGFGAEPSSVTASTAPHILTNLANDTTYEVWVTADSVLGQSADSPHLEATTTAVPNPPFNVRSMPGNTQINVSWEISPDQEEIVTGYTVHWQERLPGRGENNSGAVMTMQVSPGTSRGYAITNLINATRYDVWVTARGDAGDSEPSDRVWTTPVSDPDDYRAEDRHGLVTSLNIQKTLPTFNGERIGVYLCDVGLDSIHTMDTVISRLNEIAVPYFQWLSGGAYTPVFVPGGEIEGTAATPSDSPLSAVNTGGCPFVLRDALGNPAEGQDPSTFTAVMIVALTDNDTQTDGSYELQLQSGFATIASILDKPYYPANLREIYITTAALNRSPQVLVHEMGHSLKWPHSYSEDERFLFSQEYDNLMDIMSGAEDQGMNVGSFHGTVAINRYSMGWIAPDKVAIHDLSGGSQSYALRAAGVDPEENEYEMLVIPGYSKGHYYTLGARVRNPTGYDSALPKSGVEMYEVRFGGIQELFLIPPTARGRIQQITGGSDALDHVFDNGEGYTLESKKVRIEVTGGVGGVYTVTVTPMPGVPSPPQNTIVVRTQEAITLQWEPPADDGGSSITAYNVYLGYYNELARNVTHVATVSAGTREHTFNLREMIPEYDTDYVRFVTQLYTGAPRVWVVAVNANSGEGAESERRDAELFYDLERLVRINYQFMEDNSVRVDWDTVEGAPALDGEYLGRMTAHWRHLDNPGDASSKSASLYAGIGRVDITTQDDPSEYEYYTSLTLHYDGIVYTSPPVRVVGENDFSTRNNLAYDQPAGTYTGIQFAHEGLTVNLAGASANLFRVENDGRITSAVPFTRQGISTLPSFSEKPALLDQELASFPVEVEIRAGVSVLSGISVDLGLFHPLAGDDITFVTCAPFGQEVLAVPETFPPGDRLGCLAFDDGSSQNRLLADSIQLSGDSLFSLILSDEGSGLQSAALTLNRLLDYESATTHQFTIDVFLDGQDTVRQDFEIRVRDVDEPLQMLMDVDPAPNVVADNAAEGAGTGLQVRTMDPEGDTVSYMITNSDGSDSTFRIDGQGDVMVVQTQLVTGNDDEHTLGITATAGGQSITRNFPVLVVSTGNTQFRIISGDNTNTPIFNVDEGAHTDTLIVDLDVAGGASGDAVTYSFSVTPRQPVGGNGFTINSDGQVRLSGNLDFETIEFIYVLPIQAEGSPSGNRAQQFFFVEVQDVPEPPTAAFNVEIGESYANGQCVLAPTGVLNTPVNHAVLLDAGASNDSDSGDAPLSYSWHVVPLEIVQQPAPAQGNDALYCFTPTPGVSDYTVTLDVREVGTAFLTSTTTEVTVPRVFVPPVPPVLRAVITDVGDRRLIPFQELTLAGGDSGGDVTGYAWRVSPVGDGNLLSSPMNLPTVKFTAPESETVVSNPGASELRDKAVYTVTLEVEDVASETTSTEVELTVLPVRIQSIGSEGTGTTAVSVLESSAPNQGFGFQVQAQRVDDEVSTSLSSLGYTVRYSLLPANVPFVINETGGVVQPSESLNFTGTPTWDVTILARVEPRSGVEFPGSTLRQTFTLTGISDRLAVGLTDSDSAANEVPDGLQDTSASGVSLMVTVDGGSPPVGAQVTFSLSSNPGNRFAIDSQTGAIRLASASDPRRYQVTVNVAVRTQSGTETGSATLALTIRVLAVAVLELVDTDANSNEVQEIIPGAPVTGVTLSLERGEETPANIVYSLTANPNGLFAIDSQTGVITAAGSLDYETVPTHQITVTAQGQLDGGTMQASLSLTIDVEDLWEFMIESGQDPYVMEGVAGAEVMNTLPTMIQGLTCTRGFRYSGWSGNNPGYTTGGGDPSGRFELARDGENPSIRLKSGISLDFETQQGPHVVYINFRGRVCSGLGTGTITSSNRNRYPPLLIHVRNVNEGPGTITDIDNRLNRIAYTMDQDIEVGIQAQAVDPEGDAVTYSLTNSADGKFQVNSGTGIISSLDLGDRPSQDTEYTVTVEAASSAEAGTVFPTEDFTITVLVDEPYPASIAGVRVTGGPEGGEVAFMIELDEPVPSGETQATIAYQIAPGVSNPLSVADDLGIFTGQATITTGQIATTVRVAVQSDDRIESPESGILTIQNVVFTTDASMTFQPNAPNNVTSFTIEDKTTMTVTVAVGDAAEGFAGQAGMIPVTVSVANEADLYLDRDVVVALSLDDGTAGSGTDYEPLNPASVTFQDTGAGQSTPEHDAGVSDLSLMAQVVLIPDTVADGDENFTVSIAATQGDTAVVRAATTHTATATISDNDLRVSVAAGAAITEGGVLVFTVTLTGGAQHPDLSVGYTITGIDANDVIFADAGKLSGSSVLFATGTGGGDAEVRLTTLDDGAVEGTETATITITTSDLPPGLLLDSSNNSAGIDVGDEDIPLPPAVELTRDVMTANLDEADPSTGGVTLALSRELQENESVSVTYTLTTTNDATAADINEITASPQTATTTQRTQDADSVFIPVTAVDDGFDDDGETVEVQITQAAFTNNVGTVSDIIVPPNARTVELAITDDDESVTVTVTPPVTVEQGGMASITVETDSLVAGQTVTVRLSVPSGVGLTLDGSPNVDLPFNSVTQSRDVTIAAGDGATLGQQDVTVEVVSPVNVTVAAPTQVSVSVVFEPIQLDNTVLSANPDEADPSTGGVTLTLSRDLKTGESVSATYTLTAGNSTTADDIAGVSSFPHTGTVTLNTPGEDTIRIPVTASEDSENDDGETVSVEITGAAFTDTGGGQTTLGLTELTPHPTTLTIQDNDEAPVSPAMVVDVNPSHGEGTSGLVGSVAENVSASTEVGITAVARRGEDALEVMQFVLTDSSDFQIGADGVVTTTGPLDHETATSHTITVMATLSEGGTAEGQFTIEVTNVNEAPTAEIVAGSGVEVDSGTGAFLAMTDEAIELVARVTDPDFGDTHGYSWSATPPTGFTLNPSDGSTTAFTATQAGQYVARLQVTDEGGLSHSGTADINVRAPAVYPTAISTVRAVLGVVPEGGTVEIVIELNAPVPEGETATISYQISGDSSSFSRDDDLSDFTGTATIEENQATTTVRVGVLHDFRIEDPESGEFFIRDDVTFIDSGRNFAPGGGSGVGALFGLFDRTTMAVTIAAGGAAEGFAGAAGTIPVTVSVANAQALHLDRNVNVMLSFADGGAQSGVDYTLPDPAVVTFINNPLQTAPAEHNPEGTVLSVETTVALIPDADTEGDETFTVSIAASQQDTAVVRAATTHTATATISDNDLRVSVAGGGAITEGGTIVFTVTLTGVAAQSHPGLLIPYAIAGIDGFDVPADDGKLMGNVSLGVDTASTELRLSTSPADDGMVEGPETAEITLGQLPAGLSLAGGTASVAIEDSNHLRVSLSEANYGVAEDAGSVEVLVLVTSAIPHAATLNEPVTVSVVTEDGTAIAGEDYTALNEAVEIPATSYPPLGSNSHSIAVALMIVDSTAVETNENFRVVLTANDGRVMLGTPNTATATIDDNDVTAVLSPVGADALIVSAGETTMLTVTTEPELGAGETATLILGTRGVGEVRLNPGQVILNGETARQVQVEVDATHPQAGQVMEGVAGRVVVASANVLSGVHVNLGESLPLEVVPLQVAVTFAETGIELIAGEGRTIGFEVSPADRGISQISVVFDVAGGSGGIAVASPVTVDNEETTGNVTVTVGGGVLSGLMADVTVDAQGTDVGRAQVFATNSLQVTVVREVTAALAPVGPLDLSAGRSTMLTVTTNPVLKDDEVATLTLSVGDAAGVSLSSTQVVLSGGSEETRISQVELIAAPGATVNTAGEVSVAVAANSGVRVNAPASTLEFNVTQLQLRVTFDPPEITLAMAPRTVEVRVQPALLRDETITVDLGMEREAGSVGDITVSPSRVVLNADQSATNVTITMMGVPVEESATVTLTINVGGTSVGDAQASASGDLRVDIVGRDVTVVFLDDASLAQITTLTLSANESTTVRVSTTPTLAPGESVMLDLRVSRHSNSDQRAPIHLSVNPAQVMLSGNGPTNQQVTLTAPRLAGGVRIVGAPGRSAVGVAISAIDSLEVTVEPMTFTVSFDEPGVGIDLVSGRSTTARVIVSPELIDEENILVSVVETTNIEIITSVLLSAAGGSSETVTVTALENIVIDEIFTVFLNTAERGRGVGNANVTATGRLQGTVRRLFIVSFSQETLMLTHRQASSPVAVGTGESPLLASGEAITVTLTSSGSVTVGSPVTLTQGAQSATVTVQVPSNHGNEGNAGGVTLSVESTGVNRVFVESDNQPLQVFFEPGRGIMLRLRVFLEGALQ